MSSWVCSSNNIKEEKNADFSIGIGALGQFTSTAPSNIVRVEQAEAPQSLHVWCHRCKAPSRLDRPKSKCDSIVEDFLETWLSFRAYIIVMQTSIVAWMHMFNNQSVWIGNTVTQCRMMKTEFIVWICSIQQKLAVFLCSLLFQSCHTSFGLSDVQTFRKKTRGMQTNPSVFFHRSPWESIGSIISIDNRIIINHYLEGGITSVRPAQTLTWTKSSVSLTDGIYQKHKLIVSHHAPCCI